ncbi:acetyltransferase [Undibacterium terreum]|uniref:Acetyltransferase n=1 Tax=Undibacterium terreum TaxID=1224302 RepID=A0A916URJ2_9BURK|nr:acetyltransferase [Undibacterium terreum]GGC83765.1 acetyltransferase [Undibacterium terreum]
MKNIVIAGAGGFGREIASHLESIVSDKIRIAGFIDDTLAIAPALNQSYPYPVLGKISDYLPRIDDVFIVAIGDPKEKLRIAHELELRGAEFFSFIHPTAVIARTAKLGRGIILCPFSMASADSSISDFVTINFCSSIGHDVFVGEGSTISSHVDITGYVKIGAGVFIGSNASVLPKVEVGAFSKIGAGAIVVRRVKEGATVYSSPAKTL